MRRHCTSSAGLSHEPRAISRMLECYSTIDVRTICTYVTAECSGHVRVRVQVPCYQRSTSAAVMRPQNGSDWHRVAATVAADTVRLIARAITSSIALQAGRAFCDKYHQIRVW